MNLTADQGTPQLIEPFSRRSRRIVAAIVLVVALFSLLASIIIQPSVTQDEHPIKQGQQQGGEQGLQEPQLKQEQGGNVTFGLGRIVQIIITFIAVLSSIVQLTGVSVSDLFSSKAAKANVEEFPFYVFQDYDKLLEYLFPDPKNPLLSDRRIRYLPQVSAEMDEAFQDKGMVLIRGRSKTGKTREACEMLKRWWYSGPTVLVVRSYVGLYPPFKIPENLPLRNLIIFFDDIDRYLGEASALKRLDEVLQFLQGICHNPGEVRVVATVRQEDEFWKKLKFDPSLAPWNKFELVQLNPLSSEKAFEVVSELSKKSQIDIEPELAKTLAEKNNGTFLNLALAFRGWLSQNIKTVTSEEIKAFEGSLKNTWRKRYEELVASHPRIRPVYAAIDFMQSHNIPLRPRFINELATEMEMGKGLFSLSGWVDRLQNWFDMSPMFNWYREPKRRRNGWIVISIVGPVFTYLLLYTFLRFTPGNTQVWFFNELSNNIGFQILCVLPLWLLLIPFVFYSIMKILRNLAFRRAEQALEFLLDAEVPMRGNELRPYENQFEGNGSTNNWKTTNYAGEIHEKKFSSNASQRLTNRYLELAEQLRTNGEFNPARKLAMLAQKIFPNHPASLFMLGKIEIDEGNFQNALELLKASQSLYRRSSNFAHAQERQALAYLYLREYDNAEKIAGQALKEMPKFLTARWALGLAQIKQGKISDGQKNCIIAILSNQVIPIEIQKILLTLDVEQEEWFKEVSVFFSVSAKSKSSKRRSLVITGLTLFLLIAILSVTFLWLVRDISFRFYYYRDAMLAIFPDCPMILIQSNINSNDHEGAISYYTEAIRIDPEFAYAYYLRGKDYSILDEHEKAVADYSEAIRISPEIAGKCEYDYACNTAVVNALNPGDAQAYFVRGNAYTYFREYEKAVADYTEAVHITPQFADAYENRGEAYGKLGENEKAIADYTKAIRINLSVERGNLYYQYLNRGYFYYQLEDYEKAIADYTEAIHINPENSDPYIYRGDAYNNLGEHEKAIADYTEFIRSNPTFPFSGCRNIQCYTASINVYPDDCLVYIYRGEAYYELGEYERAIVDYTDAIRLNPEVVSAHFRRGDAYFSLQDYEKAIADYTEAIRLDQQQAKFCSNPPCFTAIINLNPHPTDSQSFSTRGDAYFSLQDYEKAIADYTEAIRIDPKYSFAYKGRGDVYYKLEEYEKAIADYAEDIRLRPWSAFFCDNISCYTAAIDINPGNVELYFNRGVAYYGINEYEKAIADYTEVIDIAPNFAEVYQKRGEAYQKLGMQAEADADFQKYKELTEQP